MNDDFNERMRGASDAEEVNTPSGGTSIAANLNQPANEARQSAEQPAPGSEQQQRTDTPPQQGEKVWKNVLDEKATLPGGDDDEDGVDAADEMGMAELAEMIVEIEQEFRVEYLAPLYENQEVSKVPPEKWQAFREKVMGEAPKSSYSSFDTKVLAPMADRVVKYHEKAKFTPDQQKRLKERWTKLFKWMGWKWVVGCRLLLAVVRSFFKSCVEHDRYNDERE